MAHPFGKMPTLAEFVNEAKAQGCMERTPKGTIRGPRGEHECRYLVRPNSNVPAILPNIENDVRLTPVMLSQLVRVLKVAGYEQLVIDDS